MIIFLEYLSLLQYEGKINLLPICFPTKRQFSLRFDKIQILKSNCYLLLANKVNHIFSMCLRAPIF